MVPFVNANEDFLIEIKFFIVCHIEFDLDFCVSAVGSKLLIGIQGVEPEVNPFA